MHVVFEQMFGKIKSLLGCLNKQYINLSVQINKATVQAVDKKNLWYKEVTGVGNNELLLYCPIFVQSKAC
jgi:hypothetical protein